MNQKGRFVVSLDFELLWGVFDHETKDTFSKRILGARDGVPQLLDLFQKYDIHATWGVVGLLFAENANEMREYFPKIKPNYSNAKLSAENHLKSVGKNENEDGFHFASSLIDKILHSKNQEVGSHTYSHYYCKEEGQNTETFQSDLESAQKIAKDKKNITLKSLIFPRNQFLNEYIKVAKKCGFETIRGNSKHYAYNNSTLVARAIRLIDSYVNICGLKCYKTEDCYGDGIFNIPASRFFRQYDNRLRILEGLKLSCIKQQMKHAAKRGKVFHFWWHPHNIGLNTEKNLQQLEEIFKFYVKLNKQYGFESKNMKELSEEIYT